MALPPDPTLDEIRAHLAPMLAANAAFDGWNGHAVDAAAHGAGVDPGIARLALGEKAIDLIDAWFDSVDAAMAAAVPHDAITTMKIRERITALVEARLAILAPDREALRRAMAVLAMPQNGLRTARLGWRSVDRIWAQAGDTATDYNHYTKRAILGAVYTATLTIFVDDESAGYADTRAFLARRIDGIMRFEKAKAKWIGKDSHRLSLSRFVGRLRYPAV